MKTLFIKFKTLFIFLIILSFQNCTDKEFTSTDKQDFISGYFTATLTGSSSSSWNATSVSTGSSSYIWVRGTNSSNDYMEFHIPLSATASTYTELDGASFIYYSSYYGYDFSSSNCSSGYVTINISEKTNNYIKGTFEAKVNNSSCNGGFQITDGSFQVYD